VSKTSAKNDGIKLVAKNRKALFDYEVVESVEAGIVLSGTEVKSLREGKLQLTDAYATIDRGEAWLHHAHIGEYKNGGHYNHIPNRSRKLLLHRNQIEKLGRKVAERGYTFVPLEVYFNKGRAKVKLGLCRGKAEYDKRHSIRDRDERRATERGTRDE
jgi:SsrA-binding protein